MPRPSSATRMRLRPPASIATSIRLAPGVERVLDQFLDRRSRPLDHLAGGDAVDEQRIETANRHGGKDLAVLSHSKGQGKSWRRADGVAILRLPLQESGRGCGIRSARRLHRGACALDPSPGASRRLLPLGGERIRIPPAFPPPSYAASRRRKRGGRRGARFPASPRRSAGCARPAIPARRRSSWIWTSCEAILAEVSKRSG